MLFFLGTLLLIIGNDELHTLSGGCYALMDGDTNSILRVYPSISMPERTLSKASSLLQVHSLHRLKSRDFVK